ncbi:methyltransferase domain-containing protein [Priestia megaterium]
MESNYLFGPFLRKSKKNNISITNNIYSDSHFVEFYNASVQYNGLNDIDILKEVLSKDDVILEIGSGNGRVYNVLASEGYNIYGLEPELEMIKYIDNDFKDKIFNIGVEEITSIENLKFSKVIIPATTISLFPQEQLVKFFSKFKEVLHKDGSIIFDLLNPNYIKRNIEKITSYKTLNSTFFLGNTIIDSQYILNIYMKNKGIEKIGYSIKNIHEDSFFENISQKLNYKVKVVYKNDAFSFLEMKNHG